MSDNFPQGQSFDTGFNFGLQGPAAEMEGILDRVKDERLRLLRLLKDCEARFGTTGVVPPAEEIARLTGKVRAIDEAVRERYKQLRHDETMVEKRAYQIDQLRECIQELTDQLESQIEKAKQAKPNLTAAREQVQNEADRVLDQSRAQVAQIGQAMASRLEEYRNAQQLGQEQLREARREIERVFSDIDQRLAAAAGLARDEAQKLIDPIFTQLENHATECGERIRELVDATDDNIRRKLEALPAQAQKTLEPTRDSLDGVIEDARKEVAAVNETLDAFNTRVQDLNEQSDRLVKQHLDTIDERVDQMLEKRVAQRMQALEERLEQREQEILGKLESLMLDKQAEMIVSLDEQLANHSQRLIEKHHGLIDETVSQRMDTAAEALSRKVDMLLSDAEQRGETLAQQVKDRLAASLEQSRVEAEDEAVRLDDLMQEDANRVLANVDQQRAKVSHAIEQMENQAIELAEKAEVRVTEVGEKIESTMREHVVNAMSQAEAITGPFKDRIDEALGEQRRISEEIAEATLSQLIEQADKHFEGFRAQARTILEQYQNEVDVQSDTALDQVHENMRRRIQELSSSSQSMVELIEKQLARRLKSIEPEAQQTADAVEKQISDRLSRMRENAEAMVKLVEDQLGKRVAELQPSAINAARDAEHELGEHMDRIRREVESTIAPLRKQIVEELANVAEVGKRLRNLGRPESAGAPRSSEPNAAEPPIVDVSRLTTPLQEMASRIGKKPVKFAGTPVTPEAAGSAQANRDDADGGERKAA